MTLYNTALAGKNIETDTSVECDRIELNGCIAFQHDIATTKGLPAEYEKADIFYLEIPWQHGYPKFQKRAGKNIESSEYLDFLRSLNDIIQALDRPVILYAGVYASKRIPEPTSKKNIRLLHGAMVTAFCYNIVIPDHIQTSLGVVKHLAANYECIGNFVCGYGYSGFEFLKAGKKFVMSDINPFCIGSIAERLKQCSQ
jgi:hypothetical protein